VTRILVVDDDPQILRALRINLRARHYDVDVAIDGTAALRIAASRRPDLVVLDLGLPDMDGVDVIRGLRGWTGVPVIVLSGRAGSGDKVAALDAGADDYVTKPFGIDELLARVRAVTRRITHTESNPPSVRIGQYTIDLAVKTVTSTDGGEVRLTPTEWHLLEILARNPGKLISQRHLLHEVWGTGYERETHYLRQYMAQLRRKLEDDPAHPRHLLTEPGMGYRFRPATAADPADSGSTTGTDTSDCLAPSIDNP
jgi:two-component system KDP operon response regulator KdpE